MKTVGVESTMCILSGNLGDSPGHSRLRIVSRVHLNPVQFLFSDGEIMYTTSVMSSLFFKNLSYRCTKLNLRIIGTVCSRQIPIRYNQLQYQISHSLTHGLGLTIKNDVYQILHSMFYILVDPIAVYHQKTTMLNITAIVQTYF